MPALPVRSAFALVPVLLLALASGLRADVLEVPGVFGSVQTAVDAAVVGDVVLVAPGVYAESVVVDGKGLTLLGDGGTMELERLAVVNVPSGQTVVIRDVAVPAVGYTPGLAVEGLRLANNLGAVRVEACSFVGMDGFEGAATTATPAVDAGPGIGVLGCRDVVVMRSIAKGGLGATFAGPDPIQATSGGPGMSVEDARVAIFGGTLAGWFGGLGGFVGFENGGHGGDGLNIRHAQLHAAGATFIGGDGGFGGGTGGNGGYGLLLDDVVGFDSFASLRDVSLVPGFGAAGQSGGDGEDGFPALSLASGLIQTYPALHRPLSSSQAPLHPGDGFSLDTELQAGDIAVVLASLTPSHALQRNLQGVLLIDVPFLRALPLPAGAGPQALELVTPPLPAGTEHLDLHVQLVLDDGAGLLLGPTTVLTVLP